MGDGSSELSVTSRVRAFVEDAMRNNHDRDGELISADSALWYVEAGLNFSFTSPNIECTDNRLDSAYVTISTSNGQVLESDAGAAFLALGETINAGNIADESHIVIVDITSAMNGSDMVLSASYVIGSGYDKALNTTWGTNDYWMWTCYGSGCACGTNPNTSSTTGADKKIQSRIFYSINNGNAFYYTDVETWHVGSSTSIPNKELGFDEFPAPINTDNTNGSDWLRDYKTYAVQSGGSGSTCLSPTDMRFYTQGTYDVMYTIKSLYVSTKVPVTCVITGDLTPCGTGCSFYLHKVDYKYGKVPK